MTRLTASFIAATTSLMLGGCMVEKAKESTEDIDQATSVQCSEERRVMEMAVESFTLLVGHIPTETEMVPDYLRVESPYFDVDAVGNVVASPGSACH